MQGRSGPEDRTVAFYRAMASFQASGSYDKLVDRCGELMLQNEDLKTKVSDKLRSLNVTKEGTLSDENRAEASKIISDTLWEVLASNDFSDTFNEAQAAVVEYNKKQEEEKQKQKQEEDRRRI